jgi:hypothetical protein
LTGSKEFLEVEGVPLNAQNVGAPTFKVMLEGFPVLKFHSNPPSRKDLSAFSSTTPPRQHCDAS